MRVGLVLLASALIVVPAGVAAQRPLTPEGRAAARAGGGDSTSTDSVGVPPTERVSTTQHTITLNGKTISYTANAGTMIIRDGAGNPKATVFYISYTRDKEDPATRPVTFFFNGGPGSASIWLNMGIMSPRHPPLGPGGSEPPPPYDLVDNPNSPLDATDLVQVDAMMTGYSRPGVHVKASDFTGAENDIRMFGQFIRNYLDKYHRWASPKYLFGESYGTFRSAGLASELQSDEGIELNGIMLLGTVLNFQYLSQSPTNDIGYSTFLPSYTAAAWYHKKLPADLQSQSLADVVRQSRAYAFGDYFTALGRGNTLTEAERTTVADQLVRLTGLSREFILNSNLRVSAGAFRTELLRDRRLTIGRYDARYIGISGNPASQREDYDPSGVAPSSAFMAAFMRYLHNDLNYQSDLQYYMGGHAGRWDYGPGGRGYPNEVESLRLAMAQNPYLHVLVGAGYYDLATPVGNAEYTFDHLGFDQTYRDRVSFKYYDSGHMAYLNEPSGKQLKADMAAFIAATEHPAPITGVAPVQVAP